MQKVETEDLSSNFDQLRGSGAAELLEAYCSPFLSLEWWQCWHRHFGSDSRVTVIIEDRVTSTLLLTEIHQESYKGLPLRVLRSIVNSHSARAALAFSDNHIAEQARALAINIASNTEWDVMRLQGIPYQPNYFAQTFCQQLTKLGCPAHIERTWAHDALDFPTEWSAYYQSLSKETRRVQERMGRRLRELGTVTWKQCADSEQLALGFAEFLALERRSWKAVAGEIINDHPSIRGFYADVVEVFGHKHRCQIDLLYLDQTCICAVISLLNRQRLTTIKTSFDVTYAKYSPGWQLFRYLLEDAHNRAIRQVDFYADLDFSKRWANTRYPFCDIIAFSPSWRGRISRAAKQGIEAWRRVASS